MGFVILENVPIGVCDKCGSTLLTTGGNRYYSAEILRRMEEIASGKKAPENL